MSKGKRRERQAAELYERAGYETFRPQESKFGETDIFGLFDVLAVETDHPGAGSRLVQVKSNRAAGIEDWKESARRFHSACRWVEFLICHDNDGWRLIGADHRGRFGTRVDEREMDCAMGEGVVEYLGGPVDG